MRITKEGQITVPLVLLERYGIMPDDDVEFELLDEGLLIRKRDPERYPIDAVIGIASEGWAAKEFGGTDAYLSAIRGYDYAAELRRDYSDHSG